MKKIQLFLATIIIVFASCEQKVELPTSGSHSGHDYVDLGLSVQWATCNVGADSPVEYGDYFAWGETETKKAFSEETYTFILSPDVLTRRYDAATANWGEGWRMPSKQEANELCEECTFVRKKINGVAGLLITGPNGNSIFLLAAGIVDELVHSEPCGYYWSSSISTFGSSSYAQGQKYDYDVEGAKVEGYYWTTVLDDWFGFDMQAYCISFANHSDGVTSFSCSMNFRELGMGIRPVYDPED